MLIRNLLVLTVVSPIVLPVGRCGFKVVSAKCRHSAGLFLGRVLPMEEKWPVAEVSRLMRVRGVGGLWQRSAG